MRFPLGSVLNKNSCITLPVSYNPLFNCKSATFLGNISYSRTKNIHQNTSLNSIKWFVIYEILLIIGNRYRAVYSRRETFF